MRGRVGVAITTFLTLAPTVRGQGMTKCASIAVAAQRLACYDALAKSEAAPAVKTTPAKDDKPEVSKGDRRIEEWAVMTEKDPITDKMVTTFVTTADGSTRTESPSLVLRCDKGELRTAVIADDYLGNDLSYDVTVRFGSEPPEVQRWNASGNGTAVMLPNTRIVNIVFVKRLAGVDRFVMQVTPFQKTDRAMVFRVAGIEQVKQELFAACQAQ